MKHVKGDCNTVTTGTTLPMITEYIFAEETIILLLQFIADATELAAAMQKLNND